MKETEMDILYFNPQELAKRWRVSDKTIHNMCNDGRLTGLKVANRLRIPKDVVFQIELGESKWNRLLQNEAVSTTSDTPSPTVSRQPSVQAAKTRLKHGGGRGNT